MRVLIDANIFISFLLTPKGNSPIHGVLEAAFRQEYTLLMTEDLLGEIAETIRSKPHLARRIPQQAVDTLLRALLQIGETLPSLQETVPTATRDTKDDYLIAYAIIGQARYLVSGDKDLSTLCEAGNVQILTPEAFNVLLEANR